MLDSVTSAPLPASGGVGANPATIAPVPAGVFRPFWSVMMPAHNRTRFLPAALASVLAQDPGPTVMQIEVIDNGSTTPEVARLVREIGGDRVTYTRLPYNIGPYAIHNECLRRARGHWVHILHDDDLVLPGFYATLAAAIARHPHLGAACCRYRFINERDRVLGVSRLERPTSGELPRDPERILLEGDRQIAATVVRRSAVETWGGFCEAIGPKLDRELWMRLSQAVPFWYEARILACYRRHQHSVTNTLARAPDNARSSNRVLAVARQYLQTAKGPWLEAQAMHRWALQCLDVAWDSLRTEGWGMAIAQMREAFLHADSPAVRQALVRTLRETAPGQFLARAREIAIAYSRNPHDREGSASMRRLRKLLDNLWMECPPADLECRWGSEWGQVHQLILDSGLPQLPLTPDETLFAADALQRVAGAWDDPYYLNDLLSAMLYHPVARLPVSGDDTRLPAWLRAAWPYRGAIA